MKTEKIVTSFLADRKLVGVSPITLKNHKYYGNRLVQLSPKFPPKPEIVQRFLAKFNPQYAATFYRYWHALGNYAEKRYRKRNFMKSVTRPRIPKEILPTISATELNLLAWALQKATPRDRAIIFLFIDCALRKGEAVNLKREDIHEDILVCHGKTGYRQVPISAITRDLILALPVYDDGFVFHGKSGKPLCQDGFYYVVKKYLKRVGYKSKHCGPQTLRRSFGRFWLKDGGDLKSLSLILGHADITTTAKAYTPLLEEDMIEIHQKHTPGRTLKIAK